MEAWLDILFLANGIDGRWQGIEIPRGSFATSQLGLSKKWKWSIGSVNNFINRLKTESRIEIETNNQFTIIRVLNYNLYNPQNESKTENKLKTSRKQLETTNERKERKERKDIVQDIFDFYLTSFKKNENQVKLTKAREDKIRIRLEDAGEEMLKSAIEKTSKSKFHQGENDRGWKADLDFILRSYEQVEKLSSLECNFQEQKSEQLDDFMKKITGGQYGG